MISVTEETLKRLETLGFETYDYSQYNALKFLIKKNLETVLGHDNYSSEDIEIMMTNKGIDVHPNDADSFQVGAAENTLVFKSEAFNLIITKIANALTSDLTYVKGNDTVREVIDASEKSFGVKKQVNDELAYSVSAKNLGVVKTGTSLYELSQDNVVEKSSFLKRITNALSESNIVKIKEDLNGKDFECYQELYNALENKYAEIMKSDTKLR